MDVLGPVLAVASNLLILLGIWKWGVRGLFEHLTEGLRAVVERVLNGPKRASAPLAEIDRMAADHTVPIEDIIAWGEKQALIEAGMVSTCPGGCPSSCGAKDCDYWGGLGKADEASNIVPLIVGGDINTGSGISIQARKPPPRLPLCQCSKEHTDLRNSAGQIMVRMHTGSDHGPKPLLEFPDQSQEVALVGGPADRKRARVLGAPATIEIQGCEYRPITDPDTGDCLGGYYHNPRECGPCQDEEWREDSDMRSAWL